jgi:hypothetical protein
VVVPPCGLVWMSVGVRLPQWTPLALLLTRMHRQARQDGEQQYTMPDVGAHMHVTHLHARL